MEQYNPKKLTYTVTVKMTGSPWNWNTTAMTNIMKMTKAQAIQQDLDKVEVELAKTDLAEVKKLIMEISNKKLDTQTRSYIMQLY